MNRSRWLCGVFAALLAGLSVANWLYPTRAFSENENRYLQTLPKPSPETVLNGKFGTAFETYTTDQFLLRDQWVGLKTLAQLVMGKRDNGRVYFGRDDTLFERVSTPDAALVRKNTEALTGFVRALREQTTAQASVLLAPTATELTSDKLPPLAPVTVQQPVLDAVQQAVTPYAVFCNPTQALREAADKGTLYYRTDHHWTTYGAYTAYTTWAQRTGRTPLPRQAFTVQTVTDRFFGTLYSKANLYTVRPDTIERYDPLEANACTVRFDEKADTHASLYESSYLLKKDKYAYFLGGNHALTEVTTSVKNGERLLLIKDSYAHCVVPFLTHHFENIVMVDLRYYKGSLRQLLTDKGITDVLVLYNYANFTEDAGIAAMLDWR